MRPGLLILLSLLLLSNSASAADPLPATQHLASSCTVAAVAATSLFRSHGFEVTPDKTCPNCLALETTHLHDLQGHSLTKVRTVMHRYMNIGREHDIFGAWYLHTRLTTNGNLTLTPDAQGCRARLLFQYTWYATEFLVLFPIDGDPASRPSNLKLEADYLAALAQAKP